MNMIQQFMRKKLYMVSWSLLYYWIDRWIKKYASLLGYNYQSSEWYEQSYSLFDKKYKKINQIKKKIKKEDRSLIKKIKSLIDWDEKK